MKIIIIGAGEVGFSIAETLCKENKSVVLIDNDAERLRQIEEQLDAQLICGSGSSPETLLQAGISQAGMVIAVSDQDEVNLVACFVAQHYSPGSVKIARLRNPEFLDHPDVFRGLRFDLFINPEREAAEKLLKLIQMPQAMDLIPFAEGKVWLAGFHLQPASPIVGMKLFGLRDVVPGYAPLAAAIYRGKELIIPRGADTLHAGDVAYFAVAPDDMQKTLRLVGKKGRPVERVMIYGGDSTGWYLARELEKQKDVEIKFIEEDEARCAWLAERLNRVTVLHGEGMDSDLLLEENIAKMDVFVAVSKDPENNVLAALLAKSLGARYSMILSNRPDYAALVPSLGIDAAVSPHLAAVSRILRFLRHGRVAAVESIRQGRAEGIEFVAQESSPCAGKTLKDLDFPEGALMIAVVRGEQVIIPTGQTTIMAEDRVVVFCDRRAVAKVEKLFSPKSALL
ncbi:MAG: Trk system potassium transporter TrkA [Myxococcales bacterium]|nr:MAG: Trk system potassium transporter TrkA [Myxococcales bacterium]